MNYNIDTLYKQISGIILKCLWSILLAGWYSLLKVIKNNWSTNYLYIWQNVLNWLTNKSKWWVIYFCYGTLYTSLQSMAGASVSFLKNM